MLKENRTALTDPYKGPLTGRWKGRYSTFLLGLSLAVQWTDPSLGAPPQTAAVNSKASEKRPLDANSHHIQQGFGWLRRNNIDAAAAEFDQCHDLSGISDANLLLIAHNYSSVSQHEKALKLVNLVLDHAKTSAKPLSAQLQLYAYKVRAASNNASAKSTQAVDDYLKVAQLCPNMASEPLTKAADILYRQNKYDQAIKLFNRAIATPGVPCAPAVYLYRGRCFEKMGRLTDALRDFSEMIRRGEATRDSNEASFGVALSNCYLERAKCYDQLGKKDLAQADRKAQEKFSRGVEDDLFGGGQELPTDKPRSLTPKSRLPQSSWP